MVLKLIFEMGKKPSALSLYVFHLYDKFGCLRRSEQIQLGVVWSRLEFKVNPKDVMVKRLVAETEQESMRNNAV